MSYKPEVTRFIMEFISKDIKEEKLAEIQSFKADVVFWCALQDFVNLNSKSNISIFDQSSLTEDERELTKIILQRMNELKYNIYPDSDKSFFVDNGNKHEFCPELVNYVEGAFERIIGKLKTPSQYSILGFDSQKIKALFSVNCWRFLVDTLFISGIIITEDPKNSPNVYKKNFEYVVQLLESFYQKKNIFDIIRYMRSINRYIFDYNSGYDPDSLELWEQYQDSKVKVILLQRRIAQLEKHLYKENDVIDTHDKLKNLKNREETFENWPYPPNFKPTVSELAMNGFYYLGTSDIVCCYSCKFQISDLLNRDIMDVCKMHETLSPKCMLIHNLKG